MHNIKEVRVRITETSKGFDAEVITKLRHATIGATGKTLLQVKGHIYLSLNAFNELDNYKQIHPFAVVSFRFKHKK